MSWRATRPAVGRRIRSTTKATRAGSRRDTGSRRAPTVARTRAARYATSAQAAGDPAAPAPCLRLDAAWGDPEGHTPLVPAAARAAVSSLDQAEALGHQVAQALQKAGARPVPKEA